MTRITQSLWVSGRRASRGSKRKPGCLSEVDIGGNIMRISDNEVKKLLAQTEGTTHSSILEDIQRIALENDQKADKELVKQVVEAIHNMPDREDVIADLRARIESGTYNPTGDEIADAMIRRAIADRVR